MVTHTPIQQVADGIWMKRDDLFSIAGAPGGKARTCYALSQGAEGLITAGAAASPQVHIVARIGNELGLPVRVHVPACKVPSPEVRAAEALGAEVISHRPGYNSVIVSRAKLDADDHPGWAHIPFGMECQEAVKQTAAQVPPLLPAGVNRIVMAVGSGMSFCGVAAGLRAMGHRIPILGVKVGADPTKRLQKYCPRLSYPGELVGELVNSGSDYHDAMLKTEWWGVELDPHYEAKAAPKVAPGDLFWLVGIRPSTPKFLGMANLGEDE